MKKIILIVLCMLCLFSMIACDIDENGAEQSTTTADPSATQAPENGEAPDSDGKFSYRVGGSDKWNSFENGTFGDILADVLWEPGYTTYIVFKYEKSENMPHNRWILGLDFAGDPAAMTPFLPDVLDIYTYEGSFNDAVGAGYDFEGWNTPGTLTEVLNSDLGSGNIAENGTVYFTVALRMQAAAGNEYMGASVSRDVTVRLIVSEGEDDSFDNVYDSDAEFETDLHWNFG